MKLAKCGFRNFLKMDLSFYSSTDSVVSYWKAPAISKGKGRMLFIVKRCLKLYISVLLLFCCGHFGKVLLGFEAEQ